MSGAITRSIAYHLGTIWPHHDSLMVAGCRRYGFHDAARRVFGGITDAALHFPSYRLPEVLAGFRREDFGVSVRYPVACHPPAWAAGSVPYMLGIFLGLIPEAFAQRHPYPPDLPDLVDRVELRHLRVGGGRVDLIFRRAGSGALDVKVLKTEGLLNVSVDPEATA